MALIAVIEDEEAIREDIMEELLDAGHEVITAENGRLGLNLILIQKPDLIICDMVMNEMMGYQVIKALQKDHPEFTNTPFIFISALAGAQDEKEGLSLGACDYITKPIDYDELLRSINFHLKKSPLLQSEYRANRKVNARQPAS